MKLSKNQLKQIRYFFEYLIAMPFFLILKPFSLKQKGKFGSFLGKYIMYPFLKWKQKKRYNILKKNIGIIYKQNFTAKQEDDIIKDYCSNIVRIFTESLGDTQMTKQWMEQNVIPNEGFEKFLATVKSGQKVIFTSAHVGNWEIAHKYLHEIHDIKMTLLYRKQNNVRLDKAYMKIRNHAELIEKRDKSSLKKMVSSINNGRVIVALLDQADRSHGIPITLFNKVTYFPSAIVKLAMKHNAQIFCGHCYRNPDKDTFSIAIEEPVVYDETSSPEEITQNIFTRFEKWIAKNPTQWFCMIQDIWKQ